MYVVAQTVISLLMYFTCKNPSVRFTLVLSIYNVISTISKRIASNKWLYHILQIAKPNKNKARLDSSHFLSDFQAMNSDAFQFLW